MGLFGTSNSTLYNTMQTNQQSQFKTMNNLLTLQENHVEDFFQYHGEAFLAALAQLMTDTVEKVLGQMLPQIAFVTNNNGDIVMSPDAVAAMGSITDANINLDLQTLLASAINSEVIMQRKMAKHQYLESQGFNPSTSGQNSQMTVQEGVGMGAAQGGYGGAAMGINQGMQSGYPIPPNGYDQMNNPYWIDPQTGQMSYSPPNSGMGLGGKLVKAAAWAKWLA